MLDKCLKANMGTRLFQGLPFLVECANVKLYSHSLPQKNFHYVYSIFLISCELVFPVALSFRVS